MNNKFVKILSISLLSLGAFSGAVLSTFKGLSTKEVEVSAYTNGDGATYYNDIGDKTGTALLSALQDLNSDKLQSRVGYSSMPSKFTQTDPGTSSGQVTSFYSGRSAVYSGNMNREHVWPASRTVGGRNNDPLEDDIHMTRPTLTSENSSRGNSFFTVSGSGGWDPATFNNESYRGDSARIIFYCIVADSRLTLVDKATDSTSNHTMGKLSDLLRWNLQYSVANREMTRNEQAEKLQGNRNPFIDHPEYACKIWGNTNATTKSICGMSKTVTLDKTTYTAHVGDYFTIKATSSDSTAITWSATGSAVSIGEDQTASGTPANVKAVAVGSSTITATSASGATATCTVTVKEVATYISLTTTGQKTNYLVGEEFSYDGVCKANYSDGTSKEVTPIVTAHGNTSAPGNFEVDLSYTENGITKVTSYTVTVNKAPAVLQSITTSGQSEIFSIGDEFKYDGTCIAHYDDGSEKDVTDMVDVRTPLNVTKKAGTYKVSLEYMEKGNLVKTSYQITVEPGMDPKPADKKKVTLPTWVIVTMCVGGGGLVIGIAIAIIVIVNKKKA